MAYDFKLELGCHDYAYVYATLYQLESRTFNIGLRRGVALSREATSLYPDSRVPMGS
jgi:hypothetical protein